MKHSTTADLELDQELLKLQSALEEVRAPQYLAGELQKKFEAQVAKQPSRLQWSRSSWISSGIAASLIVFVLGMTMTSSDSPPVVHLAPEPAPVFQVAYAQIPMRVHTLSGGAELRFLDARMIRNEQGITQAIYLYLPGED
jgi:hypothetical protein